MIRFEYLVDKDSYRPSGRALPASMGVREPTRNDRAALAELMMDAYVGTVDYHGEDLSQAFEEVDGWFASEALFAHSRVATALGVVQSAILVSVVEEEAFIGYVMTRAAVKNRGLAQALLDLAAGSIWEAGFTHIRAWITEGNAPSESVFLRAGFTVVGEMSTD